ncbi:putative GDSL esterase/lipase-like [Capsicum annuum]|nr:putative GDSL esterase/lipase-like [Capsicum annuum]
MDYNLAALKVFSSHLNNAKETITQQSQPAFTLSGILFQRVWLQGILVSTPTTGSSGRCFLDDGTGVVELQLLGDFVSLSWEKGMYVMVVGLYCVQKGGLPLIKWKVELKPSQQHYRIIHQITIVFSYNSEISHLNLDLPVTSKSSLVFGSCVVVYPDLSSIEGS